MSLAARLSMYPRKPLPYGEQLARLKTYFRRARTDLRRKYDEFFESTKGRRDCPLEVEIKHRAIEHAMNTVKLLEVCVQEVERHEAMFYDRLSLVIALKLSVLKEALLTHILSSISDQTRRQSTSTNVSL